MLRTDSPRPRVAHRPSANDMPRTAEFERLVLPHLDRLFAAAIRLARSRLDAEDLVQETLLRAWEAFDRADLSGNIAGWLYRILTNIFINSYRHQRVVRRVSNLVEAGGLDGSLYSSDCLGRWSDPTTRLAHSRLSRPVEAAMAEMDERFRTVLVLADLMDFSYREIADLLGVPEGTVMSRLFRARRFLRDRLGEFARAHGIGVESARVSQGRQR